MGVLSDKFGQALRAMAESDARLYRELDDHLKTARRLLSDSDVVEKALPPSLESRIADAVALLEANGYTVTK